MTKGVGDELAEEGLRERKRRETLGRITETALDLFIKDGYEATTLDQIAAAAGISRRTFFSYFKSKDDILLSLQSGLGDLIAEALRKTSRRKGPMAAVREAAIAVCSQIPAEEMIAIDRLMRSSVVVQARKQAAYVQHEATLLAALRERWPEPEREVALRLVAMLAIGAIRLALETMSREGGSIVELLTETFDTLEREV